MTTTTDHPTVPTEAAPDPSPDRGSDPRPGTLRQWAILGLLTAVLIGSLGYLGWHRFLRDGSGSGLAADREAAMSVADTFMVRVNTYGPDLLGKDGKTMPAYRQRVGGVLTDKFDADFLQNVVFAEATVAGNGAGRSAKVWATGVSAIDRDTATVLVVGEMKLTFPKAKGSTARAVAGRQQFRSEVGLVKQHGEWLVDSLTAAEQAPSTGTGMTQ